MTDIIFQAIKKLNYFIVLPYPEIFFNAISLHNSMCLKMCANRITPFATPINSPYCRRVLIMQKNFKREENSANAPRDHD